MRAVALLPRLALFGLVPSACALAGYDFGDYQRAPINDEPNPSGDAGDGGARNNTGPVTATAFGVGGQGTAGDGEANGGERNTTCAPQTCLDQELECGPSPSGDGCGQPLDCGACFWWFQVCRQNRCEISE